MQEPDTTHLEGRSVEDAIGSAAHEYERDGKAKQHDLEPELDPGNAAQVNIDDQAVRLAGSDAVEQRLGRGEKLGVVAGCLQQSIDHASIAGSSSTIPTTLCILEDHSNNRMPMRSMFCIGPMNDPSYRADSEGGLIQVPGARVLSCQAKFLFMSANPAFERSHVGPEVPAGLCAPSLIFLTTGRLCPISSKIACNHSIVLHYL